MPNKKMLSEKLNEQKKFDINKYIIKEAEVDSTKLREINNQLQELHSGFKIEKIIERDLIYRKIVYTYPKLCLDFLSLYNETFWKNKHSGAEITVPRFSIHKLDNAKMYIHLNRAFGNGGGLFFDIYQPSNLPRIFFRKLAMATEIFEDDISGYFIYGKLKNNKKQLPKDIFKKYKKFKTINLITNFKGMFLPETREKLKELTKLFGEEDVYLIKETEPKEWKNRGGPKPDQDVYLIGQFEGKNFYLDKFKIKPFIL